MKPVDTEVGLQARSDDVPNCGWRGGCLRELLRWWMIATQYPAASDKGDGGEALVSSEA